MALLLLASPFVAAAVTMWLGMKLQRESVHQKAGVWLAVLPPMTLLWFALLFFILASGSDLRRYLSWHVHFVTLGAFLAIEFLLLRAFTNSTFRLHAASAAALCGVAGFAIFTTIFL
ncbi:hypothetical protein PhaeoP72_01066 [Phaeobacter inhibens]|uniref:hypothetical protein n=1 Tax=Phaeobacter inhibens TaxID=221822 RepID=UPI000C9A995D|nr:hypothetical protein [Phaeobacter inhibens]AUR03054.1 hypothetical protein PhaeoP72_01066 [Phaeobacter inhibens]UWR56760.1 hypothetical protein K4F89_17350 [Phaeobacter inhibens]UWR65662.1 hypothetical protein K4L02_05325 [Phaeobacter inhibens]